MKGSSYSKRVVYVQQQRKPADHLIQTYDSPRFLVRPNRVLYGFRMRLATSVGSPYHSGRGDTTGQLGGSSIVTIWSKLDPADRDVHLALTALESAPPGHHKILRPVKRRRTTPSYWGSTGSHRSVRKMLSKLSYRFSGSLGFNDKGKRREYRTTPRCLEACFSNSKVCDSAWTALRALPG